MERDYNKNRRSFRSERSENRRGYGAEQGERYTAGSVGNRNTTRRFERTSERDNGERRERNFNREKDTYRERPAKFSTAGITVLVQRQPTGRTGLNVRNGRYW